MRYTLFILSLCLLSQYCDAQTKSSRATERLLGDVMYVREIRYFLPNKDSSETMYMYDRAGNLISSRTNTSENTYKYNSSGDLIEECWSCNTRMGKTITYTYGQKHRLLRRHDNSAPYNDIMMHYDHNDRLIKKDMFSMPDLGSGTDAAGNMTGPPSSYYQYDYDREGRKTKETFHSNAQYVLVTTYLYDSSGRPAEEKEHYSDTLYERLAKETRYSYDTDTITTDEYYPHDRIHHITASSYDSAGKLTELYKHWEPGHASDHVHRKMKYDASSRQTEMSFLNPDGSIKDRAEDCYDQADSHGNWLRHTHADNGVVYNVYTREIGYYY